jgi:hypothetical protein
MTSSITPLQWTSTLFGTVVIHAYLKQETALHTLSLIVTVFSILHHSSKDQFVARVDMIFAHILFFYAIYNLAILLSPFFLFGVLIAVIWITECLTDIDLHVFLHIFAVIGMHGYLWYL